MKTISLEFAVCVKKVKENWMKKFPRCCRLSFELCKKHRECKLHKLTSFAQVACIVFLYSKSNLNVISTPVAIYIEGGVWLWEVLLNNMEASTLLHCISSKQRTDDINCAFNGYNFIIPDEKLGKKTSCLLLEKSTLNILLLIDETRRWCRLCTTGIRAYMNMQSMISLEMLTVPLHTFLSFRRISFA